MSYRDDLEAAQARADALQREVTALRKRNADLELAAAIGPADPPAPPVAVVAPQRPRTTLGVVALSVLVVGLTAAGSGVAVVAVAWSGLAALLLTVLVTPRRQSGR